MDRDKITRRIIELESPKDVLYLYEIISSKLGVPDGITETEWLKDADRRRGIIVTLLSKSQIDALEVWSAVRTARLQRLVKILTRLSSLLLVVAVVLLVSLRYYRYRKLPRIYPVGDDVTLKFPSGDVITMNFGDSDELLYMGDDATGKYLVQKASFIPWMLGRTSVAKVEPVDFFKSRDTLRMFLDLYYESSQSGFMKDWSPLIRRRVFMALQRHFNDPSIKGLAISSKASPYPNYPFPFLLFEEVASGETYIFLTLEGLNNNGNYRLILKGDSSEISALQKSNSYFNGPLYWKKPVSEVAPVIELMFNEMSYRLIRPNADFCMPVH